MLGFNVNYSQFQSAFPLQSEVRKKERELKKKKKKKRIGKFLEKRFIHSVT